MKREREGGRDNQEERERRRRERGRALGVHLSKKLLLISQSALTCLTSPLCRSRSRFRQRPRCPSADPDPRTEPYRPPGPFLTPEEDGVRSFYARIGWNRAIVVRSFRSHSFRLNLETEQGPVFTLCQVGLNTGACCSIFLRAETSG